MTPRLTIALGIFATAALLWGLGPRPDATLTLSTPDLPADLDTWVKTREAQVTDLRPGNGRRIDWANPAQPNKTSLAVVYLHGFSASAHEVSPVAEHVAKQLGANLYFARMPGHGRTDPAAMGEATLSAWVNEGIEAMAIGRRLGHKVLVISTSTGGTLSHWLAASGHVQAPDAVAMISPNFGPQDPLADLVLWPWFTQVAVPLMGAWRESPANVPEEAQHWTLRYPTVAVVPMMQLVHLSRDLPLEHYRVPTLVMLSPNDQVVNPAHTKKVFARMTAPDGLFVTDAQGTSQHVIAGDIGSPNTTPAVVQRIADFARRALPASTP